MSDFFSLGDRVPLGSISSIMELVKDAILTALGIFGAIVAAMGLSTWKRQLQGKSNTTSFVASCVFVISTATQSRALELH